MKKSKTIKTKQIKSETVFKPYSKDRQLGKHYAQDADR
jgi:hypothetical protein